MKHHNIVNYSHQTSNNKLIVKKPQETHNEHLIDLYSLRTSENFTYFYCYNVACKINFFLHELVYSGLSLDIALGTSLVHLLREIMKKKSSSSSPSTNQLAAINKSLMVSTMKFKAFLVIFLILIVVKYSDEVKNDLKLVIDKMEETHKDYVVDFQQQLRISDNFTYYYSVNASPLVKLESVYLSYSIDLANSNGQRISLLKKTTIDLCSFFKNLKGNKLLNWFYKKNTSGQRNLPTSCPVEPNSYFLKDFKLDEINLWNDLKFVIDKMEETHVVDFQQQFRISDNFTYYYSVNATLRMKLESVFCSDSIDLANSNGHRIRLLKRTTIEIDLCSFFKNSKGNKLLNCRDGQMFRSTRLTD
ncbi:CLUMA_CG005693, isoform A [Clunio marinus]|uniref:CLUMA_CG005693, isoform A n=1 Tax=Clunio marinus TaxID=568069 RepID=A0A1J1HVR6_9DIPT|nr:CLUMA_CG005693, isoform A [Clunio marinus]